MLLTARLATITKVWHVRLSVLLPSMPLHAPLQLRSPEQGRMRMKSELNLDFTKFAAKSKQIPV